MFDLIKGFVRHLLTIGSGYLGGLGLINSDEQNLLVSSIMAIVAIGWSGWDKHSAKKKLNKAIMAPAKGAG